MMFNLPNTWCHSVKLLISRSTAVSHSSRFKSSDFISKSLWGVEERYNELLNATSVRLLLDLPMTPALYNWELDSREWSEILTSLGNLECTEDIMCRFTWEVVLNFFSTNGASVWFLSSVCAYVHGVLKLVVELLRTDFARVQGFPQFIFSHDVAALDRYFANYRIVRGCCVFFEAVGGGVWRARTLTRLGISSDTFVVSLHVLLEISEIYEPPVADLAYEGPSIAQSQLCKEMTLYSWKNWRTEKLFCLKKWKTVFQVFLIIWNNPWPNQLNSFIII